MRRILAASARAFASPRGEGGNPVSVFLPSTPTTPEERAELAQSCSWESVVVELENDAEDGALPTFHFYMPSGEEVSFCGHAAIGACSLLANKQYNNMTSNEKDLQSATTVPFLAAADRSRYEAKVSGKEAQLTMNCVHEEADCNSQSCSLEDVLSAIGLENSDIPSPFGKDEINWPTFINSSVARPKTLIPLRTIERLHAATPPRDPEPFAKLCDSIDSTGMDDARSNGRGLALECRQFPRSSGYAEDPATGIAAGALAASLLKRRITFNGDGSEGNVYGVRQGTAMGRPSKIGVKIDDYPSDVNATLKVSYTGRVVFDPELR